VSQHLTSACCLPSLGTDPCIPLVSPSHSAILFDVQKLLLHARQAAMGMAKLDPVAESIGIELHTLNVSSPSFDASLLAFVFFRLCFLF
jgi:hypothetical protein